MKAIIQRVSKATVTIDGYQSRSISNGLVVFLGIGKNDHLAVASALGKKILDLRVFPNKDKMDLSVKKIVGSVLIISQFTLYANCNKGNRPSFTHAAKPIHAKKIYTEFVNYMYNQDIVVETGVFGENMVVSLVNDGPVTLIMDTEK